MEKGLLYRIILVGGILFIALLSLVPTVNYDYTNNQSRLPEWWQNSGALPRHNLVLGLDLFVAGGRARRIARTRWPRRWRRWRRGLRIGHL